MDTDIPKFSKTLQSLREQGLFNTLPGVRRGLEKEALRVLPDASLSQTSHPKSLGASLTHPHITTDYAESLLEFMTTPWTSARSLLQELSDIQTFTYHHLNPHQEKLWATSMPCLLPSNQADIPIAQYGKAYRGQIKTIYRHGLGLRYGRKMQTIAGIHYNFSFPDSFWSTYQAIGAPTTTTQGSTSGISQFISQQYFHLMRNALRWRWLLPLWFGASPALDSSFLSDHAKPDALIPGLIPVSTREKKNHTWISPYATSLRLSPLGYNNIQSPTQQGISYNNLTDFLAELQKAVTTVSPAFSAFGIYKNGQYQQLNNTYLQIENEFYGIIRPKHNLQPQERLLHVLKNQGVGYLEIRALDLNPFEPSGVSQSNLQVLDVFLTTCLLLDSPSLSTEEEKRNFADYQHVITQGRKKGSLLPENTAGKRETLIQRAAPFLDAMRAVAECFDQALKTNDHQMSLDIAISQVKHPETESLSAKVFETYAAHGNRHIDFGQHYSEKQADYFTKQSLSEKKKAEFDHMATLSLQKQKQLDTQTEPPFSTYLDEYLKIEVTRK
jgi:glutamate--cysteine ligase